MALKSRTKASHVATVQLNVRLTPKSGHSAVGTHTGIEARLRLIQTGLKRLDRFSSDVNHFFRFSRRATGFVLRCAELPWRAMHHLNCVLVALVFVIALATRADAAVVVNIDRSVQRMSVVVDGMPRYNWRVSTARRGYITPPGTYHPETLARHWFSRKYYNSPMPHSIFFYGGFAIHGSYEISHLGRPASHGCVRLDPGNAAILFSLVQREGMGATTIMIH